METLFPVIFLGRAAKNNVWPGGRVHDMRTMWSPYDLANCPAVFLSYFSLWICYEIQPAVGTPYTAVQNVWTISPARNHQFESSFWLKRLAIYM